MWVSPSHTRIKTTRESSLVAKKAHPGFKAEEAKIAREPGIRNPGAVLAAASRGASAKAKAANPRLRRVKGKAK